MVSGLGQCPVDANGGIVLADTPQDRDLAAIITAAIVSYYQTLFFFSFFRA